jgi:L-ascorbate metabolism protein UlaG (beta-lactamase superfamily)
MRAMLAKYIKIAASIALLLTIACSSTLHAGADSDKSHHTTQGYKNNYFDGEMVGSLIKWQWQRLLAGLPKTPAGGYQFTLEKPDLNWLKNNRSITSATWIGHATVLLQIDGVNILTDPIFSERASPVQWVGPKRQVAPAINITALPHIDVVLISHNHYDHLDLNSVLALNAQSGGPPLFMVPLGVKKWMAQQGIHHVQELDWWQHTKISELTVHFVPVQHWSARSIDDRFETLWGGWVLKNNRHADKPVSVFFTGDTGYSKDFADIHQRLGDMDLALIPIGAYEPRWFMQPQHVNPAEAVKIHQDMHAKKSLAIHWGTFELTDESLDEPPRALNKAKQQAGLTEEEFVILNHGGMLRF